MSALNESFARIEMPPTSGEAALPVIMPAERVDGSMAAAPAIAAPAPARRHSGFGVASFVWSLLLGGGEFAVFVAAGMIGVVNPSVVESTSPLAAVLGLLLCAGVPASLVGIALGIVGLYQKDRRKIFAILGVVFNTLIILGIGLLILIGSQMPVGTGPGSST